MVRRSRRRFLAQLAGASGALLLPASWLPAWAQSEAAARLLRLPKIALVVGNAAYAHVPVLANPHNDAQAIAAALRDAGFTVTTVVDSSRAAMSAAIAEYERALAARQGVGAFYFAGHGVQLAWRNYLLPVDASVRGLDDVAAQCIDVNALMAGLRRAGNAMNLVILDACRDNPFGTTVRIEQRGLSQMDAPPRTLLAYATAPGNMASDGTGANGLYTEHLVREMAVREAKVEDVFKRVRLGVRRASRGAQIPWESTSLEDDFYFLPPEQLRRLSEEQEARLFAEERAVFEAAKSANDVERLADYLHRYPSGRFAELAQLQLDRLLAIAGEKRVVIASSEGNPHTQGTARADTEFRVGDRYAYRIIDKRSGEERTIAREVTSITDDQVVFSHGKLVLDLLGNVVKEGDKRYSPRQDIPLEYAVGKHWTTRFEVLSRGEGTVELDYRVAARERITVPAGQFDCFRIEGRGYNQYVFREPVEIRLTFWRAPQVRRMIAFEDEHYKGGRRVQWRRHELVGFRQA